MQTGIGVVVAVVVACWVLVLGHQLGVAPFNNPDQYAVLKGSMAFAYVMAALSVCAVGILVLSFFKK